MRMLLIGGAGFMGPFVARDLLEQGHEVAVFHRGKSASHLPVGVHQILGDRAALANYADQFRSFAPDVVVDFILSSGRQALETMDVFRGMASRLVALSSGDVYRAGGILHGIEPGPIQAMPLTEDSDRRTQKQPYRPEAIEMLRKVFGWLDNEYDKIPVEDAVMSDPALPGTVLRLPMVYGPGDPLHRLFPYLKRIDDGRPAILIQEDVAGWRGPRGYVENVAHGISLAATSPHAANRIYNIAEQPALTEIEWARNTARVAGWKGSVIAVPKANTPGHLQSTYNMAQDWIMSSARIREELGYSEPVALDIALGRTIAWERENPPAQIDPKQFDYEAEDAALATV